MSLPIAPVVLPSALKGTENGRLPASKLTQVGPSGWLESTAARSWKALVGAGKQAGHPVTYTYGGTYRTFVQQLALFTQRYEPIGAATYLLTAKDKRKVWPEATQNGYPSIYWRKRCVNGRCPASAAAPGHSNHGLGIGVDGAFDRDPSDGIGPDDASTIYGSVHWPWFERNVPLYGFSWELVPEEPWHIRYTAGDAIPLATLEWEAGLGPLPPPSPPIDPTQEDDMALAVYRFENDDTGAVMATDYTECWWVPTSDALNTLIWSRLAVRQPLLDSMTGVAVKGWGEITPVPFSGACAFGPLTGPVPPAPSGKTGRDVYGRPV